MHWFQRIFYTLTGRLVVSIFAIHLILIPAIFTGIYSVFVTELRDQFVNEVRGSSGWLTMLAATYDPQTQTDELVTLLDNAVLGGRVVFARIDLGKGQYLTSDYGISVEGMDISESLVFGSNDDPVYFSNTPVFFGDSRLPVTLLLGFDESSTRESITHSYIVAGWLTAGYMILSLLLVAATGVHITKPLRKLQASSRRISRGETGVHLDVEASIIEISELSHDLNRMQTELVEQATTLRHQAMHDSLTDLPNRVLLDDRLEQTIGMSERNGQPFSLLLIDLNHFKEINDTLGHSVGDELLRQTAGRLRQVVRDTDTVARTGGDEFVILLQGADLPGASSIAKNIIESLKTPYTIDQHPVFSAASIGIVQFPTHGNDSEVLLRRADMAMYSAKRSGGGYCLYSTKDDRYSMRQLALNADINKGLIHREFVTWYQPKINLVTGQVCGAEALIRWNHPRHGLLGPDQFIHYAERSGIISELTKQIIEMVISDVAEIYNKGRSICVSLNLSPHDLVDTKLPARLRDTIEKYAIEPALLKVEITETAILQNPELARELLEEIKEMGVGIAIDDFGTGYSSLSHLKQLPVTEIKIDRSFIIDMMRDRDDKAIVAAMIGLAKNLGLVTTAEGVETREVFEYLAGMGCDQAQGYYFAKPMPFAEFSAWLHKTRPFHVRKSA